MADPVKQGLLCELVLRELSGVGKHYTLQKKKNHNNMCNWPSTWNEKFHIEGHEKLMISFHCCFY